MAWFRKQKRDAEGYVSVKVSAETLTPTTMIATSVGDTELLLTCYNDVVVAFARDCPHAAADLSKGGLSRGRVSCPEHGWNFDIVTGRTLWPEDEACRLKRYDVRVVDGIVWVKVD